MGKINFEINKIIGERIREIRKKRNISQAKLADRIGITFQQIQKYEKGTNNISVPRLLAISDALGVNPLFFLGCLPEQQKDMRSEAIGKAFSLVGQASKILRAVR